MKSTHTAAGNTTPDQMRGMLQSLLADRFKLALRRETRTMPVYELVVANGGLKIAAMKAGGCIPPKEVRWDLLDWEAPRYFCDTHRKTDSEPVPRNPAATTVATSDPHRRRERFDGGARRRHLGRGRPRRDRQDRLHSAIQSRCSILPVPRIPRRLVQRSLLPWRTSSACGWRPPRHRSRCW